MSPPPPKFHPFTLKRYPVKNDAFWQSFGALLNKDWVSVAEGSPGRWSTSRLLQFSEMMSLTPWMPNWELGGYLGLFDDKKASTCGSRVSNKACFEHVLAFLHKSHATYSSLLRQLIWSQPAGWYSSWKVEAVFSPRFNPKLAKVKKVFHFFLTGSVILYRFSIWIWS